MTRNAVLGLLTQMLFNVKQPWMPERASCPYAAAVRRATCCPSQDRVTRCRDEAILRRIPLWIGEELDRLQVPQYALEWIAGGNETEARDRADVVLRLAKQGWSWSEYVVARSRFCGLVGSPDSE